MILSISKKITDKFVSIGTIPAEDKDLYVYGFQQGFLIILNIVTTIIIALIFNMVWQILIFTLAYIPLRTYAGGYHAKTQVRCYLFSIVMIIVAILGIRQIPWNSFICLNTVGCTGIIISLFAPVEDNNKLLNLKERYVYKKRTHIILCILIGLTLFLWFIGHEQISICIIMALIILAAMLILGKVKLYYFSEY